MITDNEILVTGELCEALLASDKFTTIIAQYELTIAADILATAPQETKKRESLYATLWGARGLLEFMKVNMNAAQTIKNEHQQPHVTTEDAAYEYDGEQRDETEEDDYR